MSAANRAVTHILNRIADDSRVAYWFLQTTSLELLVAAEVEANGGDATELLAKYNALPTEAPRCRSGECAERGLI